MAGPTDNASGAAWLALSLGAGSIILPPSALAFEAPTSSWAQTPSDAGGRGQWSCSRASAPEQRLSIAGFSGSDCTENHRRIPSGPPSSCIWSAHRYSDHHRPRKPVISFTFLTTSVAPTHGIITPLSGLLPPGYLQGIANVTSGYHNGINQIMDLCSFTFL